MLPTKVSLGLALEFVKKIGSSMSIESELDAGVNMPQEVSDVMESEIKIRSAPRDVHVFSYFDPPIIDVPIDTSPSLTDQSFKDECDINHIMAKYAKQVI